jgi:hypothetical protein
MTTSACLELRLLQHYRLDEGGILFDLLSDPTRRLLTYKHRPFLRLAPTPATARYRSPISATRATS